MAAGGDLGMRTEGQKQARFSGHYAATDHMDKVGQEDDYYQGRIIGRITCAAAGSYAASRCNPHLRQESRAERQLQEPGLSRRRLLGAEHHSAR